jgi:cytochrome b561
MFLKVLPEFKKDGPFFTVIGFLCGLIQYVGYSYFDKKELGSEFLLEHIAFGSLILMIIFLWLCGALLCWKPEFPGRNYLDQLVTHISHRAVAFALVATFVIFGFALAALAFNSYGFGAKFLSASLYFLALAEISASPRFEGERSACYLPAMGFIIATPFTF